MLIPLITLALGASILGIDHFYQGKRGKVLEQWETANATFRVRVTAYEEKALIIPGAIYVFQSALVGSEKWQEIMALEFDDPVPIPREHVCFVDHRTAYAFMGETYAVTTDGGQTWTQWNSEAALKDRADVLSRSIMKVDLSSDGSGRMQLYEHPDQKGAVPILRTQDYGRNWN